MQPSRPITTIDSYDFETGKEGLSSSQNQFDIYFYQSSAAAGLGNRNVLNEQNNHITRYTDLDIITANGETLTNQTVVLLEILGEGTFADCYKAEYNGRLVAVKILKAFLHSTKQREAFERELHALRKTAYSNLTLDLIGYRPQPHYWIITSYMNEGTLNSRIKAAEGRPLPLREVLDVGVQISAAMQYLHAHLLMHRDLTPFNLLFHDGSLRLADFGVTVDLANLPDGTVPPSSPLLATTSSSSSTVVDPSSSPFSFAVPSFLCPTPLATNQYDSGYLTSSQILPPTQHPLGFVRSFHHEDSDGDSEGRYAQGDGSDGDDMALDETTDDEELDDGCVEMGDTSEPSNYYDLAYNMSPNGHPYYRAPEVNEGRPYSLSAEVYNFGSVLYECMTGTVLTAQAPQVLGQPTPAAAAPSFCGLRRSAERERRGNGFPDELWRLQAACWERDPRKRPSFDSILQRLTALRETLLGELGPTRRWTQS
jgi:serine/threonine protein kinase